MGEGQRDSMLPMSGVEIQVEQEKNHEKVFAIRHEQARLGVKFEEFLRENDLKHTEKKYDEVVTDFLMTQGESTISDSLRTIFENIYIAYSRGVKQLEAVTVRLQNMFWEEPSESLEGSEIGRYIFSSRTKVDPIWPVYLEKKHGFFVLYCEEEDYNTFVEDENSESGGIHHTEYRLPTLESFPLILIKGNKTDSDSNLLTSIEAHEEQHFINHALLDKFQMLEIAQGVRPVSFVEKRSDPVSAKVAGSQTGLKDEILAYLKDGSSGFDILEHLNSKLYQHFFTSVTAPEATALRQEVRNICQSFSKEIGQDLDACRGLLVYHLVDIPFLDLAEYIAKIGKWYKKETAHLPRKTGGVLDTGLYPRSYQTAADEATGAEFDYNKMVEVVWKRALVSPGFKIGSGLARAFEEVTQENKNAKAALRLGEVRVPHFFGEVEEYETAHDLLDVLAKPEVQPHIDELYQAFDGDETKSLDINHPLNKFFIEATDQVDLVPIALRTELNLDFEPAIMFTFTFRVAEKDGKKATVENKFKFYVSPEAINKIV